jgi:hypothetical protein
LDATPRYTAWLTSLKGGSDGLASDRLTSLKGGGGDRITSLKGGGDGLTSLKGGGGDAGVNDAIVGGNGLTSLNGGGSSDAGTSVNNANGGDVGDGGGGGGSGGGVSDLIAHRFRELTMVQPTWLMRREMFVAQGGYAEGVVSCGLFVSFFVSIPSIMSCLPIATRCVLHKADMQREW